jgi:hypothetical protein
MTTCIVCRRDADDVVCEDDRAAIAQMLTKLPARYERLAGRLVPGQGAEGPKSSTPKIGAPSPVRDAALSLLAGGNESVSGMLHPLVRRWKTTSRKMVSRVKLVDGVATIVSREEEITDYHREFVVQHDPASGRRCRCGKVHDTGWKPVEIPDDDQVGTLPPREWLDTQVRHWRLKLGDHVPPRTIYRPHGNAKTARAARVAAVDALNLVSSPRGREVWSYLHAVEWMRQREINARLGLVHELPPALRPLDPLQDEIEARFGEPPRSLAMAWDVKYLLAHLDTACDRGEELGLDVFAAELQALTAEILRVLGEEVRQQWIGRCPAVLQDPEDRSARKSTCGAGLWQEIGWAQVTCPRCHTTWDTCGSAGRTLAREIRKRWPVDRRRRYNAEELAALVPPRCPGCRERVIIEWREVTGSGEKRRWWQARSSRCENRCEEAGRVL